MNYKAIVGGIYLFLAVLNIISPGGDPIAPWVFLILANIWIV